MSDINVMKNSFKTKAKDLSGGQNIGDKTIDSAFDLAQNKIKDQGQTPDPMAVDMFASDQLGLYDSPEEKKRKQTMLASTKQPNIMQTSKPTPVLEGYVSFEEEMNRIIKREAKKKDEVEKEPIYQGQTKEEAAEEIVATLKKKKMTKNAIVHALISRLQMDLDCAIDIVYGDKGIPDDEEVLPSDPLTLSPCEKKK